MQRACIVLLLAERPLHPRRQPACHLALATALRRRRRRGASCATRPVHPASRLTPPTPSPRCSLWPAPSAWRGHPLNRPRPGAGRRDLLAVGPAHLGCPSPPAASRPQLQALERSGLRREGRGHRRPLHGPATPRRRALARREEPEHDPGPGAPAPAGPSHQVAPRPRPTTTSPTAPRRCLPRSTYWRAP